MLSDQGEREGNDVKDDVLLLVSTVKLQIMPCT